MYHCIPGPEVRRPIAHRNGAPGWTNLNKPEQRPWRLWFSGAPRRVAASRRRAHRRPPYLCTTWKHGRQGGNKENVRYGENAETPNVEVGDPPKEDRNAEMGSGQSFRLRRISLSASGGLRVEGRGWVLECSRFRHGRDFGAFPLQPTHRRAFRCEILGGAAGGDRRSGDVSRELFARSAGAADQRQGRGGRSGIMTRCNWRPRR